jgi:hypothetical protein
MKVQRLVFTLTAVNFVLLAFLLAQLRPVQANSDSSMLRGRGLEIVDDQGRVRASIKIYPADDAVQMPDGSRGYPETVLLRLIDPNGRPGVKLDAHAQGAGMSLAGDGDTYAVLGAKGAEARLRLKDKLGREFVIRPTPSLENLTR